MRMRKVQHPRVHARAYHSRFADLARPVSPQIKAEDCKRSYTRKSILCYAKYVDLNQDSTEDTCLDQQILCILVIQLCIKQPCLPLFSSSTLTLAFLAFHLRAC